MRQTSYPCKIKGVRLPLELKRPWQGAVLVFKEGVVTGVSESPTVQSPIGKLKQLEPSPLKTMIFTCWYIGLKK